MNLRMNELLSYAKPDYVTNDTRLVQLAVVARYRLFPAQSGRKALSGRRRSNGKL